jgi:hypothetical protein
MTADLSALIARLEAAEAGSRELDDAVWLAATGEKASYPFDDETDPHIRYGTLAWVRLPRSTTSLDAALALAERLFPAHAKTMTGNAASGFVAFLIPRGGQPIGAKKTFSDAALALCIATLRAKLDGYEAEGEVNKNPKAQEG